MNKDMYTTLACPKCNSYMFPALKRRVQIDCCANCSGVWLDKGELATIYNTPLDMPREGQEAVSEPTSYHCPRCGGALSEQFYSSQDTLLVDVCEECKGVYLDKGELDKIRTLSQEVDSFFPPTYQDAISQKAKKNERLSSVYKTAKPVAKLPLNERAIFIKKVYVLLIVTLITTAIGAYVGIASGLGLQWFLPAIIAEVVVFLAALWQRRTPIVNMILLFVYTSLSGFTMSAVLSKYLSTGHGAIVWQAATLTACVFTVLSMYVHLSKKDFSWMGGMLITSLFLLVITGIILIFCGNSFSVFLWSAISALLFCGFILYDTSRIILKYDTNEVVAAVLDLYLDIVNLFLDLLRVMGRD